MNQYDNEPEPECPLCGCRDLTRERRAQFAADFAARYSCNHCLHSFTDVDSSIDGSISDLPEVIYNVTKCPQCQSANTVITRGPAGSNKRRYHLCRACNQPFRSRESVK